MNNYEHRLPAGRSGRKILEAGQSMVEVAFILPLFLALVFAIFEIGRAWGTKQSLTNAAREGARILVLPYGADLGRIEGDVQTAAKDAVISYLNNSGVPVGTGTVVKVVRVKPGADGIYGTEDDPEPEVDYTEGKRGERVGIQITHDFDTALPLILGMFGDAAGSKTGIKMGASCYMAHE